VDFARRVEERSGLGGEVASVSTSGVELGPSPLRGGTRGVEAAGMRGRRPLGMDEARDRLRAEWARRTASWRARKAGMRRTPTPFTRAPALFLCAQPQLGMNDAAHARMVEPGFEMRQADLRGSESAAVGAWLGLSGSVGFEWWRSLPAAWRLAP
jgi:hypothetical protein